MSSHHERRPLPPLRSLQVFEAAARHETFTGAARELNVSQGAVSRQVQELERWIGADLFVRSGPNIKLTATGRKLGEQSSQALALLRNAVTDARPSSGPRHVTLSMLPSVAAKWLAPRLGRFIECHPDIDLRITASRQFVDFQADEVDAAIRYGGGDWPGLDAELLARETVTPVCSPQYATKLKVSGVDDLPRTTLLHTDISEDWAMWFRTVGLAIHSVPRGPSLGDDAATLQAAIEGQGVAMGRSVLIAEDLQTGRLTAPFEEILQTSFSYWFVMPVDVEPRPDLIAVKNWLIEEFSIE